MKLKLTILFVIMGMILPGLLAAAEVLTRDDFVNKVVTEKNLVKTADNFIILFDSSNSMASRYKKGMPESRYDVAKRILREKLAQLPDLGYNAGLYLFTPYKEVYPAGPFNKSSFMQAVDSLPAEPKGPTLLPQALRNIEPILNGLSGKTVVFIFSDGTYSQMGDFRDPEDYTLEMANKHDVCFYMIGSPQDNRAQKQLTDMAKANACSRVIPFERFIENPEYAMGALYVVNATQRIETTTEKKIIGLNVKNIHYDFDSAKIDMDYFDEVDDLGAFLQKNPTAYVLLEGYTDNTGSEEYNLQLSLRRAESVANYLKDKYMIADERIVMNYYGAANPVASNANAEGRAMNRRVEVAVGGL
jgi:OOP family OmpA-OmpF porin